MCACMHVRMRLYCVCSSMCICLITQVKTEISRDFSGFWKHMTSAMNVSGESHPLSFHMGCKEEQERVRSHVVLPLRGTPKCLTSRPI